jgi:cellulose synthase/poly-beta-1,6-N-acetylglucosamine synthase-like glycosyltransferase
MIYLVSFIILIYTILILAFIIGFDRIKVFKNIDSKPKNGFSIIVPFRNESSNLPDFLTSLLKLEYPIDLFEALFIDDDSNDNSVEIINNQLSKSNINFKIISNKRKSNSPKKDAIETAILQSKYDWIITTDADCIITKKWVSTFDSYIQTNNPKMICAPVTYKVNDSLLENFQLLDFISLIGSTIGGFGINKPFLCNGANLCYSKNAFKEVNGFEGNNNISSGDDIFLLEKMTAKFQNQVHFLKSKESLVITKPQSTFKELISQRIRWASKSKFYKNRFGKLVGVLIFTTNFTLVFLVILSLFKIPFWKFTIAFFSVKFILDFILIYKTLNFTNQARNIIYYSIIAFLHLFFTVFIAFLAFLNKQFEWKNRISKV